VDAAVSLATQAGGPAMNIIPLVLCAVVEFLSAQPRFYVIDFAPVDNLKKGPFHSLTFVGSASQGHRIDLAVVFNANRTATEVRDLVARQFNPAALSLKKIGDTKLVISGCKKLDIKTRGPEKKEFPENCRPTLTFFLREDDATGKTDMERMPTAVVVLCAVWDVVAAQPRFYVIDFAPVDNLKKQEVQKILTFTGSTAGNQRIDVSVAFEATKTAAEVRELVVKQFNLATLSFKKVGDTKLVVLGCKEFAVKSRDLLDKELPENCRPTLKLVLREEDATGKKDK
jgi:hypothetical protein